MHRSKPIGSPADRVTEKLSALQKDPALIVYQAHPLNVGTPPACVRQMFLTPKERFFVRNHSGVPQVDVQRYRLSVTGMVQSPLHLSLDELRATFPEAQVIATLQCAGHRRKELAALRPIPGEIPWGADATSTAIWCGVPLREVLLAAGMAPGAQHVAFLGLDTMERGDELIGFGGHIERVELSVDEGATWTPATLLEPSSSWTWRFWEATLTLPAGTYQIAVRAWDSAGRTQPQDVRQVWNWKGYLNHAWHHVKVVIQERTSS